MSWFPFVSRDRFDEKAAEARELRSELAQERANLARLNNWLVWRLGGVAPDVGLLPEAYQPKAPAPVTDSKNGPQSVPNRRRPGQARYDISTFENDREKELAAMEGRFRGMPQGQKDVISELNQAANEVTGG